MGNFIEVKKHFEEQQLQMEMERNKIINETLEEDQRLFGYYKCIKCKNKWASAYSWLNKWQQCNKCQTKILPHKQTKLIKSNQIKSHKSHNMSGCQKCIELGHSCDS